MDYAPNITAVELFAHEVMPRIRAVHPERYLTFLQNIYHRWTRIDGASAEVIPNIHPANRSDGYPKSAVGQAGFHMTDTSCPISAQTWEAAYASALQKAGYATDPEYAKKLSGAINSVLRTQRAQA